MKGVTQEIGTEREVHADSCYFARPVALTAFGYLGEWDVQLMCRVRDGDLSAYAILWERHRKPLFLFLHRMVGYDFVAEELAQEVFLRVYRSRATYEPSAKFTTWLFRIASHVGINWLRDRRHEVKMDSLERDLSDGKRFQVADYRPTAEQRLVAGSKAQEIRQAIKQLPVNQRAAVILHKYREFDYLRIAQTLNCSESAVKSLLFRAYQHLRETLAHFDGTRRVLDT